MLDDESKLLASELLDELLTTLTGIDERLDGVLEPPPEPPQETRVKSTLIASKDLKIIKLFILATVNGFTGCQDGNKDRGIEMRRTTQLVVIAQQTRLKCTIHFTP